MEKGSLALTSLYKTNNFNYSRIKINYFNDIQPHKFGSRFYNYTENEVSEEVTKIWSNYPSNISNFIFKNRIDPRRESSIPNFTRHQIPPNRPDYFGFENSIFAPKRKNWNDYLWLNKTKIRLMKFKKTFNSRDHMICGVDCRHCWTLWDKDET